MIFRDGTNVFGYFEADDLEAAGRYMAAQPVNARWQETRWQSCWRNGCPTAAQNRLSPEVFRLD